MTKVLCEVRQIPKVGRKSGPTGPATLPVLGGATTQTASGTKRTNPDQARQEMIQMKLKKC